MLNAIETYLALRRATGFAMSSAEYLLRSFAAFAAEHGQSHVQVQTAIDWAALGPTVAQRDARLRAVCRFRKTSEMRSPPISRAALRPARLVTCSCAISRRFDRSGKATVSRQW